MLRVRKPWLVAVMGGLALLCATSSANAEFPSLWLGSTGGGNSGVIAGSGGNPATVMFSGALLGDPLLTINTTTGISQLLPGGGGSLDIDSVNVAVGAHSGTDTLFILLSQTGFGPTTAGTLTSSIGGTLDPNTTLQAWGKKDASNTLWGGLTPTVPPGILSGASTTVLGPFGPFASTGPFSGTTSVAHPAITSYSLTEEVEIEFLPSSVPQTVSFNFTSKNTVVPEPTSMVIAGLGALGFIAYGLWRRKAQGA